MNTQQQLPTNSMSPFGGYPGGQQISAAGAPSGGPTTASNNSSGMNSPGGKSPSAATLMTMNHQDFLSAQARERQHVLQVLQQQQQRQLSMASTRGLPVLQSMTGHDLRGPGPSQRFMVDDFTGALLSRPEHDFLLARSGYHGMATNGMTAFGSPTDGMDLNHSGKLADFLIAKQASVLNSAQMLPKVTRLPCQARGMKADHNSSTAFFEIPEDARHGQHLLCSHPTCRSAGVKFRYCLYCKKPVTKQNFRSRHLHAELDPNNNSKMGTLVRKRQSSFDDVTSADEIKEDSAEEEPAVKQRKLSSEDVGPDGGTQEKEIASTPLMAHSTRCHRWASLLKERPQGLDEMSVWIGHILSTSDPKTSFPADSLDMKEEENAKPAVGTLEDRWNSLLVQRPEADAGDVISTKWLTRVLETSYGGPKTEEEEDNARPKTEEEEDNAKKDQISKEKDKDLVEEQAATEDFVTSDKV